MKSIRREGLWLAYLLLVILSAAKPVHCAESSSQSWLERASKPIALKSDEVTLKFGLESRYRFEYRDDLNFNSEHYEDDALNLFRNHLNADLKIQPSGTGSEYRFFAEAQSALNFAQSGLHKTHQFVNRFDLRQLFLEVKNPFELAPVVFKAGRQELSYGDERFVGPLNWMNTARVFDAVKVVYNPWEWLQSDFFFSYPVRIDAEKSDRAVRSDRFSGIYLSYKKVKDHVFDTFLFNRYISDATLTSERSGKRGELKEYTLGNRFKGKCGRVDYGTEYAFQFGRRAHDEILAWAFHQEAGYTFLKTWGLPRIYAEFNHASGDRNPSDGMIGTFDQLFPTNHNKYGLIDLMGFKNMNDIMLGSGLKPTQKISTAAEFHWFFLDAKESPWFNASGGVVRASNSEASTQLGQELDLYATYAVNRFISFLTGYSHFFAGPFTEDALGGDDGADFFYTQVVFKI